MTDNKKVNLEWDHFYLPNIPVYQTKLTQEVMDRLWGYVDNAKDNWNSTLAGNIEKSLLLKDEDDFFMNHVVGPIAEKYVNHTDSVGWIQDSHTHLSNSLVLSSMWVNFQNQFEFNPIHHHSGLISFVVWMKIPTKWEDQHALPISKNSASPSASDFQFSYSDMLGGHQDFRIHMGETQEGWILVFPAQLRHQVYPFYNCDKQRVSISGNICWNSQDFG